MTWCNAGFTVPVLEGGFLRYEWTQKNAEPTAFTPVKILSRQITCCEPTHWYRSQKLLTGWLFLPPHPRCSLFVFIFYHLLISPHLPFPVHVKLSTRIQYPLYPPLHFPWLIHLLCFISSSSSSPPPGEELSVPRSHFVLQWRSNHNSRGTNTSRTCSALWETAPHQPQSGRQVTSEKYIKSKRWILRSALSVCTSEDTSLLWCLWFFKVWTLTQFQYKYVTIYATVHSKDSLTKWLKMVQNNAE